jgi:myo-inositol-1-phosphate synthase
MKQQIKPADGKLAILMPGLGAVATTVIAGVEAVKKGLGAPIGSLTQMSRIRLGKRTEDRNPLIKEFVPLAQLSEIVFGGWDVYADNVFEAAINSKVLEKELLLYYCN